MLSIASRCWRPRVGRCYPPFWLNSVQVFPADHWLPVVSPQGPHVAIFRSGLTAYRRFVVDHRLPVVSPQESHVIVPRFYLAAYRLFPVDPPFASVRRTCWQGSHLIDPAWTSQPIGRPVLTPLISSIFGVLALLSGPASTTFRLRSPRSFRSAPFSAAILGVLAPPGAPHRPSRLRSPRSFRFAPLVSCFRRTCFGTNGFTAYRALRVGLLSSSPLGCITLSSPVLGPRASLRPDLTPFSQPLLS